MLFNVVLVIFLIVSFMITFAAIGNCLIRLRALGECIDNIHKVQTGMCEVMKVTSEYDSKQLQLIEDVVRNMNDISKHARMIVRDEERFDVLENNVNTAVTELHHAITEYNKIVAETYAIKPEDTVAEPSKSARKSARKAIK